MLDPKEDKKKTTPEILLVFQPGIHFPFWLENDDALEVNWIRYTSFNFRETGELRKKAGFMMIIWGCFYPVFFIYEAVRRTVRLKESESFVGNMLAFKDFDSMKNWLVMKFWKFIW